MAVMRQVVVVVAVAVAAVEVVAAAVVVVVVAVEVVVVVVDVVAGGEWGGEGAQRSIVSRRQSGEIERLLRHDGQQSAIRDAWWRGEEVGEGVKEGGKRW